MPAIIGIMATSKKLVTSAFTIFGAVMLVISIADIPAKALIWEGWFASFAPHLHTLTARCIGGVGGLVIALVPRLYDWARPKVEVTLRPINGAGTSALIVVKNDGADRRFAVQCELLALRNSPNKLREDHFTLKWNDSDEPWTTLVCGQSAKVLLATWQIDHRVGFASMSILELAEKSTKLVESAGWVTSAPEKVPEYDLRITVLGEGTRKPLTKEYTLRPARWTGPLEIVPRTTA